MIDETFGLDAIPPYGYGYSQVKHVIIKNVILTNRKRSHGSAFFLFYIAKKVNNSLQK
jgi:hypothetical protein